MADIESLDTLILRDIEITERGRSMMAEDMLPAKSLQNDETFFYDPIRQRLLSDSESKAYRPLPPELSVDASVFESVFPEALIRAHIQSANYRWFGAASHIERLESQSVQILWKDTPCSVEMNSGELAIVSKDEALSSYVRSLECDDVYNRFIAPVFDCQNFPGEEFPELEIESVNSPDIDIFPVSQALSKWPESARVVILRSNHLDMTIPDQASPHQAVIVYHDDGDSEDLCFEWNEKRNGCKLTIREAYPVPGSLRLTDEDEIHCRRIYATFRSVTRQLLVAFRLKICRDDEVIAKPLRNLSALVNERAGDGKRNAAVIWEGESQFMANLLQRLTASILSLEDLVIAFYSALADCERINGTVNRSAWTEALFKMLCEGIASSGGIELAASERLIQTLSKHGPHSEKHISQLLEALTQRMHPPRDLDALKAIRTVFLVLDPNWSPNFPSNLFTTELIRSILESFPDNLNQDLLAESNDFFRPLSSLLRVYEKISTVAGEKGIEGLTDDDDYVYLIKSQSGVGLADLAHVWASEMEALSTALRDYGPMLNGTRLEEIDDKVAEIARWTAKLIGALSPNIQSVYVFDTSALIAQPRIVADIRVNELFVVTKRLIEELDDKKLDESLRSRVSEAVHNLRSISKEQIQFCDGDMSLLPSDYRMKSDNLILSVAVRFRRYKPILITNDNNLSLKAQAEGIAAMTADEFEGRPRSRAQHHVESYHGHSKTPTSKPEKKWRRK